MRRVVWGTGAGIGGSLFFYLWTNFGVWFLDSWGMYSKDLGGLVYCYMNGLPFLKNSLKSSVILVPFILTAVENVDQLRTIFTCWQKRVGRRAEVFVAKIS